MGKFKQFLGMERRSADEIITYSPSALGWPTMWGENRATSLSALFGGVNLIGNSLAKLPIMVQDRNNKNTFLFNHPVAKLFSDSDNGILCDKFNLIKCLITSAILRGNGYAYIQRGKDGLTPVSLRFLEPGEVTYYYDKKKDIVTYQCPIVSNKNIDYTDMIHVKMWTWDGIGGVSVIGMMKRTLDIAHNEENTANKYFEHGGAVQGVLVPPVPVDSKQMEGIKTNWQMNTSPVQVLNRPMSWVPMSISNKDSEFLESRKYSSLEILKFLNIPPQLLGMSDGTTYASVEMAQEAFYCNCLSAYIAMCEAEFNRKLLKPSERNLSVYFETNDLLRTDKQKLATYYTGLANAGLITPNEVRLNLGLSPIEGGDELRIAYSDPNQNKLTNNEKQDKEEKTE